MPYKGWKATLKLPPMQFINQPMLPSTGDGSNTTFYSYYKPITDNSGNVTNDENNITIKVNNNILETSISGEVLATGDGTTTTFSGILANYPVKKSTLSITDGNETFTDNSDGTLTGSLGGSGTINYETGEYSVTFNSAPADSTNITADYTYLPYTLTGADGKIVMSNAPADGASVTITYYIAGTIGYVTSLSFSGDSDTNEFYALGSEFPVAIATGNIKVTMDIERAYVDTNFMDILADYPQQEIEIDIDPDGDGTYEVIVAGKVNKATLGIKMGDVVTASFSIAGKLLNVS